MFQMAGNLLLEPNANLSQVVNLLLVLLVHAQLGILVAWTHRPSVLSGFLWVLLQQLLDVEVPLARCRLFEPQLWLLLSDLLVFLSDVADSGLEDLLQGNSLLEKETVLHWLLLILN